MFPQTIADLSKQESGGGSDAGHQLFVKHRKEGGLAGPKGATRGATQGQALRASPDFRLIPNDYQLQTRGRGK